MPKLFLDLDGVLADFDSGFAALYAGERRGLPDAELWRIVGTHPDFFDALTPMTDALDLFEAVRHLDPIILTACPRSLYEWACIGKSRWVGRVLGAEIRVITVKGGRNKPLHMTGPGDVLIDDWAVNIAAWEKAGGVGIHHVDATGSLRALAACGILS